MATRDLLIRQKFCQKLLRLSLIQALLVGDFALRIDHLLVQPLLCILVQMLGELFQFCVVWLGSSVMILLRLARMRHVLHAGAGLASRVAGVANLLRHALNELLLSHVAWVVLQSGRGRVLSSESRHRRFIVELLMHLLLLALKLAALQARLSFRVLPELGRAAYA